MIRKRPCLFSACVFLTGLIYEKYQMPAILLIPLCLWVMELMVLIRTYIHSPQCDRNKRNGHVNNKMHETSRAWKGFAGRSILLLSAFLIGMSHMQSEEAFRDTYLSKIEDGDKTTIYGELINIETTESGFRMILSDCYISLQEEQIPCNNIMVYSSSSHYLVGKIYQITGQIHLFQQAGNVGNFDAEKYYQSQKIDFCIYEKSSKELGNSSKLWRSFLLQLRERIKRVYDDCMNEKSAGFYTGMVLGDKTNLDDSLKELFALGGISHILAISGLHVSIIGRGCYRLLRKTRRSFLCSGLLAGSLLFIYCNMVGNGMSAVRAVGMMLLNFLAQYMGRSYDMLNALGFMCIVLLWKNPFLVEYSGFWFSVTALLGVGVVGDVFADIYAKGKGFWMSLGITLSTLPVTALCYYEIPLYSTVINFMVLPILTPVFCLALFGGVLGIWFPQAADILFFPCEWLLRFYEWICTLNTKLPASGILSGMPSTEKVVVYYIVLLTGILFLCRWKRLKFEELDLGEMRGVPAHQKMKTAEVKQKLFQFKKQHALKVGSLAFVCFCILLFPAKTVQEITFLDVGQGDGIFIQGGDGTAYFIDGGSSDIKGVGEYRILPFLKSKRISEIDYWFVSHADTDHISGLLEVLESGYPVRCLAVAEEGVMDENLEKLITAAKQNQTEVLYMKPGDKIASEQVSFTCLYPWKTDSQDRNELCMVLLLELQSEKGNIWKALFTGDVSGEIETMLQNAGLLEDVDLFKAGHHGSKYSNQMEFLKMIAPEAVVVSCGVDNSYGHPHKEAVERIKAAGSVIWTTAECGQVTVKVSEYGIEMERFIE